MRASIAILLLAACGGSTAKTSAPPTTTPPPAPMAQPAEPPPAAGPEQPAGQGSGSDSGAFASLTGTGDIASGFDDTDVYGGLLGDETPDANSNAKGSGTGKRAPVKVPVVKIGQPQADGDLDKAIIRRYIKRNVMKIQYCYEKELLDKPKLAGSVTAKFTIGADGKVSDSEAKGLTNVDTCVAAVIKGIEFPKPKGGSVKVSYPFVFVAPGS